MFTIPRRYCVLPTINISPFFSILKKEETAQICSIFPMLINSITLFDKNILFTFFLFTVFQAVYNFQISIRSFFFVLWEVRPHTAENTFLTSASLFV